MTTSTSAVIAVLVSLLFWLPLNPVRGSEALPPSDAATLRTLTRFYRVTRESIRDIEFSYVYRLNGLERRCYYARSGERFYHASIDPRVEGGGNMPREVAWDGQIAAFRRDIGELVRGRNREMADPSCDTPDLVALLFVDQALGYRPDSNSQYRPLRVKEAQDASGRIIEAEFEILPGGLILTSRHAAEFGYLPVSVKVVLANGEIGYELSEVQYERRETDGNVVFFPVRAVTISYVNGKPGNTITVEVDRDTLRMNEPSSPSRFVLEPWPIDVVYDADTGKAIGRRDPTWLPVGKVGFPWDVFLEAKSAGEWASDLSTKFSPRTTASIREAVASAPAVTTDAPPTPQAHSGSGSGVWWLLSGAGVMLVAAALMWNLHQRRRGI